MFTLFQVLFIISLTTFLVEFVDYAVLFKQKLPPGHDPRNPLEKIKISDCVLPFTEAVAGFSMTTWSERVFFSLLF